MTALRGHLDGDVNGDGDLDGDGMGMSMCFIYNLFAGKCSLRGRGKHLPLTAAGAAAKVTQILFGQRSSL